MYIQQIDIVFKFNNSGCAQSKAKVKHTCFLTKKKKNKLEKKNKKIIIIIIIIIKQSKKRLEYRI